MEKSIAVAHFQLESRDVSTLRRPLAGQKVRWCGAQSHSCQNKCWAERFISEYHWIVFNLAFNKTFMPSAFSPFVCFSMRPSFPERYEDCRNQEIPVCWALLPWCMDL